LVTGAELEPPEGGFFRCVTETGTGIKNSDNEWIFSNKP
jgi:hypothetical protein